MGITVREASGPPPMFSGQDMAKHLVDRNPKLVELLTEVKLYTQYGVNLAGVRDMVREADHFLWSNGEKAMHQKNRQEVRGIFDVASDGVPNYPSEAAMLFCHMNPAARGRLRLIGMLAEGDDTGVRFSLDDIAAFANADPGLVEDFADALKARFIGI